MGRKRKPDDSDLLRWVSNNNPRDDANYAKGFWDYCELLQFLARRFSFGSVTVENEMDIATPPPIETLRLPVVCFSHDQYALVVAHNFAYGGFAPEYLVSLAPDAKISTWATMSTHAMLEKAAGAFAKDLGLDGGNAYQHWQKEVTGFSRFALNTPSWSESPHSCLFPAWDEYELYLVFRMLANSSSSSPQTLTV